MYSLVCSGPGRKPQRRLFSRRGSCDTGVLLFQDLLLYLLQLVQALKYEDFDKIKEELFEASSTRRDSISQEEGTSSSPLDKEKEGYVSSLINDFDKIREELFEASSTRRDSITRIRDKLQSTGQGERRVCQ